MKIPVPVVLILAALGCATREGVPKAAPPLELPIDSARISVQEAAGWPHRTLLMTDLDGDGAADSLVMAADVQVREDNTPLWEDGHRWALWVEGGTNPTLLYGAFVPNGHVEAAVSMADRRGRRHVAILERTPHEERSFLVDYEGPGKARAVSDSLYSIERRVPNLMTP